MDKGSGELRRALQAGDREFREIADNAPVMIWRAGTDGSRGWFNKQWLDFTGRKPAAEVGEGWLENVHPEDRERCVAAFAQAFAKREPVSMEYRLKRRDDSYRWLLDNGAPYIRDGEFAGYYGSCVDLTAHRQASEYQETLINELNHRVKNTLAVVQSIAQQTFKSVPKELRDAFDARLQTLASAHALLGAREWAQTSLRDVVERAVSHCDRPRIDMSGPDVALPPPLAVSLSLALHELCTNALKYGAFSSAKGRADLAWTVEAGALRIVWKEIGGPRVGQPTKRGFGTKLLERAMVSEFGGSTLLDYRPDGVICTIQVPFPTAH